ncbi:S-layer family protein [Waterburya agarophytonicola K14]|uniref:S-layer family protein n=1 Tax=Waterburya agarophytonicola KI4 TaxID=2874699 RepID=A0A964FJB5_9CYAN|nr:hypothetical protein [Waterburya agarophytonicola]MCC0178588.1 S-layer family protein [Waterburya agarophytonicola KI4]
MLNINGITELIDSNIFSQVAPGGVGEGGTITVNTTNLSLLEGSQISSGVFGTGNAGIVTINAADTITFQGINENGFPSGIVNNVAASGIGNAGNIDVTTANLNLVDGGTIRSNVLGQGNGGQIKINASNAINVSGFTEFDEATTRFSSIESSTFSTAEETNNAGNIDITADSLSLSNQASLSSSTSGNGNAGSILVNVNGITELIDSNIFSQVGETGTGSGGTITLNTTNLSLLDGASLNSTTFSEGNAGNITISSDSVLIDGTSSDGFGSGIFSQISSTGVGSAGEIKVETSNISVTNGGLISAETLSNSSAGNLTINASESIKVIGLNSGLFSRTGASGNSGIVNLNSPQLIVQNNAQVGVNNFIEREFSIESSGTITRTIETGGGSTLELSPDGEITRVEIPGESIELETNLPANVQRVLNSNQGTGDAGTLNITAANIELTNGGTIAAISAGGNGGEINIREADRLTFRENSNITATAAGIENVGGSGGNISIDSDFIIAYPQKNNNITANAFGGSGGNISISSNGVFGIRERSLDDDTNDINASSEFSVNGNISISILNVNPIQGITELPNDPVGLEETTAEACKANRQAIANSGLTIEGKGGVPQAPEYPLGSDILSGNTQANSTSSIPQPIKTSQGKIQPARGIERTENGEIILTAYRTNNQGDRLPETKINCGL